MRAHRFSGLDIAIEFEAPVSNARRRELLDEITGQLICRRTAALIGCRREWPSATLSTVLSDGIYCWYQGRGGAL
jgi:hypothetical protein